VLEQKLAVKTTELLRERNFGVLEGITIDDIKTYDSVLQSLTHKDRFSHKIAEGYESDEEMTTRLITFLRETAVLHPGKTIFCATHGGAIKSLLIRIGFLTYQDSVAIENTGYIILLSDGVDFFVEKTKGIKI
jgi:broad specificity phosphatase PhoE